MTAIVAVISGSLALAAPQLRTLVSSHHSDHEQITLKSLAERSYIYDSKGQQQGVMTNRNDPQNRIQVPLSQIPDTVKHSVLAVEDANFYRHKGVNIRSIARAVDANVSSGSAAQGGSTITQQVVKNSLVGDEKDFSRKLREAFLAVELEKQMSKNEILEYYLNSVYFGGGAYGVQAASEYYFNKDVAQLNWAEGALLASLIRSPNEYNPFRNPKTALVRRRLALRRIVEAKYLTADEAKFMELVPLPTTPNKPTPPYDYFVEQVKQQLLNDARFGLGATEAARNRTVFEGGIKVYTTFDPDMQAKAIQARNETLPANQGDGTFSVTNPKTGQPTFGTQAIVSVEPSSGAVRVMVGGPGFDKWKFNLALSKRQPGSTMKTFVAATLFEEGYVPTNALGGGSCTFKWPGESKTKHYAGKTGTIQSMLTASSNCGFIALGQEAGVKNVADMANRVGIKSSLYLTDKQGQPTAPPENLPLGTMDVSPFEMASAYATFANDGRYNEPYLVERIEDRHGKVLYQHQSNPKQVIEEKTARLVTQVLEANIRGGTGTRARIDNGQPAGGKTGTTDNSTDVWFVGYTPQLATAIWMGAPAGAIDLGRNPELRGATGGQFPAKTWGRYYSMVFDGQPIVDFPNPVNVGRGKSFGKVPNQVGGYSSGSGSGRPPRRTTNRPGNGNGTGTSTPGTSTPGSSTPATTPSTLGTTPPATTPPNKEN